MEIKIAVQEGTNLLRFLSMPAAKPGAGLFPDKVGDRSFPSDMRATIYREMEHLRKLLRHPDVSPLVKKHKKLLFGPAEAWKEVQIEDKKLDEAGVLDKDRERTQWVMDQPDLETELKLTGSERSGAHHVLYLWLHPESPYVQDLAVQDTAWELAKRLKFTQQLEEEIGLKKNTTWKVEEDKAPAAEVAEAADRAEVKET